MNLLAGTMAAKAAGGLFNGARSLLHELKQPRVSKEDFSAVLREQVARSQQARSAERGALRAERLTDRLMKFADADGDGALGRTESGMDAASFAKYDANGDGKLSRDEVRAHVTKQLGAAREKLGGGA